MHCNSYRREMRRARRGRHRGFRWGRLFGPGEVRLALLSLLAEGPRHGYELMKALEDRSDGVYRASAGTVYPTLQQLEDEGLASSSSEGGKRVYRLTDAGRREVEDEAETIEGIWRRTERLGDWGGAFQPEAAEIARPALKLMRSAARAVLRSGHDPEVVDRVREILEDARREIRELRERD